MKVFYLEFSFYYNFLVKGYEKGHEKLKREIIKSFQSLVEDFRLGEKGTEVKRDRY